MGVKMSRSSCCYCRCRCPDCGFGPVSRLLRRIVYFFQWKIESVERDRLHLEGEPNRKVVKGVVTSCGSDYGWIDNCVFFSTDVVIGPWPLRTGEKVLAFVEEDPMLHDLRATEVTLFTDDMPREPGSKIRDISVCVTHVKKDTIYIADQYYFFLDSISKAILGFMPYEGDWLDIEYSTEKGTSKIVIHSLKARKYRQLEEVCVTSIHKQQGVLNHTIFFTLDSLKLPEGYVPLLGHTVNVVIIQSVRPNFTWRAVSMSPVHNL